MFPSMSTVNNNVTIVCMATGRRKSIEVVK